MEEDPRGTEQVGQGQTGRQVGVGVLAVGVGPVEAAAPDGTELLK